MSFPLVRIAGFTVVQAGLSTLVAATVGLVAAFFTARRTVPFRRFLLSLAAVPLCLPALIMALGVCAAYFYQKRSVFLYCCIACLPCAAYTALYLCL